jgi:alkylated DNA repair dioxygenase AlkB
MNNFIYVSEFFSPLKAEMLMARLKTEIEWQQGNIKIFGKIIKEPRLTAWYGEKAYTYSGKLNHPKPWNPLLMELKNEVEHYTKIEFNSVLLNYYRNGADSMGWHSDDENELGEMPFICSLSFGSERKFQIRTKFDKKIYQSLLLGNGSLLMMQNDFQQNYQHQVPKTTKKIGERINLTFRKILT